jgi:hypothetical protein
MRMASSVSYCRRYCSTWGTPWSHFMSQSISVSLVWGITTPAESRSVCLWLTPMGGGTTHHNTTQLTFPLMRLRSMMQLEGLSVHSAMLSVIVCMSLSSARSSSCEWLTGYHSTCWRWWPYWHPSSGYCCTKHWPWMCNNGDE